MQPAAASLELQVPGACRQCLPWHHCPAHHHLPKQWGSAVQGARSGQSTHGCDNKAEECKHRLQVTGDFSLFFDKVKSRKDHALSVFRHDCSLLGGFPALLNTEAPNYCGSCIKPASDSKSWPRLLSSTIFRSSVVGTGYLQWQELRLSDATFTGYFPLLCAFFHSFSSGDFGSLTCILAWYYVILPTAQTFPKCLSNLQVFQCFVIFWSGALLSENMLVEVQNMYS